MAIRVEEYLREDGSNPYKAWFDSLDPRAAAKVTTAKLRLELFAEYKARKKALTRKAGNGQRKR